MNEEKAETKEEDTPCCGFDWGSDQMQDFFSKMRSCMGEREPSPDCTRTMKNCCGNFAGKLSEAKETTCAC